MANVARNLPVSLNPHLHSPASPPGPTRGQALLGADPLPALCSRSSHSVAAGPAPAGLEAVRQVCWQGRKDHLLGCELCPMLEPPHSPARPDLCASVAQWLLGTLRATGWRWERRQPQSRGPHCSQVQPASPRMRLLHASHWLPNLPGGSQLLPTSTRLDSSDLLGSPHPRINPPPHTLLFQSQRHM